MVIKPGILKSLTQKPTIYQQQVQQIENAKAKLEDAEQRAKQSSDVQPEDKKKTKFQKFKKAIKEASSIIGLFATIAASVWGIVKVAGKFRGVAV
jgi:hypothetical protein